MKFISGEATENNKKRIHSGFDPTNEKLKKLTFQLPPAYEGRTDKNGRNIEYTPEHYFIFAISGCFFTTFSVVSQNSNLRYESLKITSKGYMGTSTGKKMMEKIEQDIELTIPSNMNERKALRVLEITEERCPLAKSVETNIVNNYQVITL